ncbi:MAG: class II fumarate hydratase, partial [Gammaproteobacteria bacterium]|nr:class II fumarate hydratase [Gammaproteobacteria bacterium]
MSMLKTRIEHDSMGPVEVTADRYWGAQTQRSLHYFSIGEQKIPLRMIYALVIVKKSAAYVNFKMNALSQAQYEYINQACEQILTGALDDHFPLHVWMTGSGTQANMNVNEVISNLANQIAGHALGSNAIVHPNDHVNKSQSTNDIFPTAMHIAVAQDCHTILLPSLDKIIAQLEKNVADWKEIVKIGRTHMQDAVPMTLGQEFSGYHAMLKDHKSRIKTALEGVYPLALGGTAVGTGLNVPAGFVEQVIQSLNEYTNISFSSVSNKFAAQGAHDALGHLSAVLRGLAMSLYKIANDIRLLSS